MDPALRAVSLIAPVLAPIAAKIINKWIFEDDPQVPQGIPQVIQVAAPLQCHCRCSNRTATTEYDATTTCSTCGGNSTTFDTDTKRYLNAPTATRMRSSSTSGKSSVSVAKTGTEKLKPISSSRSARSLSNSRARTESKKSQHDDTLAILAHRLSKEIKDETGRKKTLSVSKIRQGTYPDKKGTLSQFKNSQGPQESTKPTKSSCNNKGKSASSLKSSSISSKASVNKPSKDSQGCVSSCRKVHSTKNSISSNYHSSLKAIEKP